jgi:rhamnosyltransferase
MTKVSVSDVVAVIIFYYPDAKAIEHANQLSRLIDVIVVDNSDFGCQQRQNQLTFDCDYISNSENHGIAKALNQGMEAAFRKNKKWCLLLDQDSRVDEEFLQKIRVLPSYYSQGLIGCQHLETPENVGGEDANLEKIAAIIPSYFAENLERFGDLIQVNKWSINRLKIRNSVELQLYQENSKFVLVSYGISSGSLVNLRAYKYIGEHDESLFIDFVDIEWGLRANACGFKILTNTQAVLKQQLGEQPITIFGCKIVYHKPMRHYYYLRNVFLMVRKSHIPFIWKVIELAKLPIRVLVYGVFAHDRKKQWPSMLLGIWHGLKNIKGKKCK